MYMAFSSPKQEGRKEMNIINIYKFHGLKVLISLPQPQYQSYDYYQVVVSTYLNLFLTYVDVSSF
jgi:hypothetical protein